MTVIFGFHSQSHSQTFMVQRDVKQALTFSIHTTNPENGNKKREGHHQCSLNS